MPPVRSRESVEKQRKRVGKRKTKSADEGEDSKKDTEADSKPTRIRSFDYGAWDRFNVVSTCVTYLLGCICTSVVCLGGWSPKAYSSYLSVCVCNSVVPFSPLPLQSQR